MTIIKGTAGLLCLNWKGPRGLNSWKCEDDYTYTLRQMTSDKGRMSVYLFEILSL
jgi:hypothetical protein